MNPFNVMVPEVKLVHKALNNNILLGVILKWDPYEL